MSVSHFWAKPILFPGLYPALNLLNSPLSSWLLWMYLAEDKCNELPGSVPSWLPGISAGGSPLCRAQLCPPVPPPPASRCTARFQPSPHLPPSCRTWSLLWIRPAQKAQQPELGQHEHIWGGSAKCAVNSQHGRHRTVCSGTPEGPPAQPLVSETGGDAYSTAAQLLAAGIKALDKEDQLFNQHLHADRALPALPVPPE